MHQDLERRFFLFCCPTKKGSFCLRLLLHRWRTHISCIIEVPISAEFVIKMVLSRGWKTFEIL